MAEQLPRDSVVEAFANADLGDKRLKSRLIAIVETLAAHPDKSFPRAFETSAELEAFYRFVRNKRVRPNSVLAGYFEQTQARAKTVDEVIAIHDSTTLSFGDARVRKRTGLGRINRSDQGMLLHATLVLDAASHAPLGIIDAHVWTRPDATRDERTKGMSAPELRELPRESDKWLAQALRVEQANPDASFIHVMDSEADDYQLLCYLQAHDARYCIRGATNRRIDSDDAESMLGDRLASLDTEMTRTIQVSARGRLPGGGRTRYVARDSREATVAISSTRVAFKRPGNLIKSTPLPESLDVNIVYVREQETPDGEVPIEWILLTNEPVRNKKQMLRLVDIYRKRWMIEEYFKALKTGCSYEKRQLDSRDTLEVALGLFVPIAGKILELRALERADLKTKASDVLTKAELFVLQKKLGDKFPKKPTLSDAINAIARLGGHIKNNGRPGWQVLMRGYDELANLAAFTAKLGIEM